MKKSELINQINNLFPDDDLDIKITIRGDKKYTIFTNISIGSGYVNNIGSVKASPYISFYLKESDATVAIIHKND